MITVYRYQDLAAFCEIKGKGGMVYMSLHQAREVAKALNKVVQSIERERFSNNTVGTIMIEATGAVLGGNAVVARA